MTRRGLESRRLCRSQRRSLCPPDVRSSRQQAGAAQGGDEPCRLRPSHRNPNKHLLLELKCSPDVRPSRQEAEVAQGGDEVGQGQAAQAGQARQVQHAGVAHRRVLQHNLLRREKVRYASWAAPCNCNEAQCSQHRPPPCAPAQPLAGVGGFVQCVAQTSTATQVQQRATACTRGICKSRGQI